MRRILSRSTVVAVAIGLAFASAGLYVGLKASGNQPSMPRASSGPVETLLAQQMTTPDGTVQSLSQWKNRKIVVNFWATWCAPCVEEMPALSAMQQALTPNTVQIIGIGIDTPANIKAFTARHGISYPIFVAGIAGTELMRQFGNKAGGLPYSVLIDGNGKIIRTYIGKLDMNALQRDITALPPNT